MSLLSRLLRLRVVLITIVVLTPSLIAVARVAQADTRRIVLVAGNNTGMGNDVSLKYAQRDAERVASVFEQLGQTDHIERLMGADARGALAAFQRMQQKVSAWKAQGHQVFFLFYYSGHGTERGIRMRGTELSTDALLASLSLVGADVRFAVIDSCESGTFTRKNGKGNRTKGVRNKRRANVELLDRLDTKGEMIMASTSQGEAAQESERLKGSFFTSYWLTGLRGAADRDRDGAVSLTEAYAYAYDRTLVSTMITASGIQHPTFSTKMSGRDDIKLTWPRRGGSHLRFRAQTAGTFMVLSRDEATMLAEVPTTRASSPRLALRPGTYVIKKRSPDGLYIAMVKLERNADAELHESEMRKVPYAVLVEKGDAHVRGWFTFAADLTPSIFGQSATMGINAGYMRRLGSVFLWPTIVASFGSGESGNSFNVLRTSLAVVRRTQRPRWSTFLGMFVSTPLYLQRLGDQTRKSLGFGAGLTTGGFVRISETTELLLQVSGGGEFMRSIAAGAMQEEWKLRFSESADIGARVRF